MNSLPVFKNGAAPLQVTGLVARVLCIAEIDQIKVDALDVGATQIGAPKIGFADFRDRLEISIAIIIGVKTGPAPFACDGAAHQAVADRSQVKARASKIGVPQIRVGPIDVRESCTTEISAKKTSPIHPRTGESGVAQVGVMKVSGRQVDTLDVRIAKIGSAEARPVESSEPQVQSPQTGVFKNRASEVGALDLGIFKTGSPEIGS